jgi:hypothetical protein
MAANFSSTLAKQIWYRQFGYLIELSNGRLDDCGRIPGKGSIMAATIKR